MGKSTNICPDCEHPFDSWTHMYYGWKLEGRKVTKSQAIVFSILADFTDRRGLRQEWEEIDFDMQEEIIGTWVEIADKPKEASDKFNGIESAPQKEGKP
jgi:hypothetical protein